RGLTGVEQLLTWRTAPIKRVDELRIDYKSSRNAGRQLHPPPWVEKAAAETPAASLSTGNLSTGSGAAPGEGKGMGGMGMMGSVLSGQSQQTKNGLELNRYTDPEDKLANRLNPVRHMPVAMVVIMDEDQIHEFLGAFANSRLRIQVLQCHWHHTREKIKPGSESTSTASAEKGKAGTSRTPNKFQMSGPELGMGMGGTNPMSRGGIMASMKGAMKGGGMMMMPGTFPGMGNVPSGAEEEEEAETSLVEVAVYGLASLYSKFPPRPEGSGEVAAAPTK